MSSKWKLVLWVVAGLFILMIISPSSASVSQEIEQDSNLNYCTSITGKTDQSDKADVYTSKMSVPETARYIMDKQQPESYTDLDNKECIQLTYDDHYILIYKGDDSKTYVQTSSRKYIHQNGYSGLYHPFSPGIILLYGNTYTSGRYYKTDARRYGGGYYQPSSPTAVPASTGTNSSKLNPDNNSSGKIRTDSSNQNKIRTTSTSNSVRSGSIGSRSSIGGGTSFGK